MKDKKFLTEKNVVEQMRCKINTNVLKYILYRYIIKKNWKGVDRMASTIQVRVDDDIKTKADVLFKDLGMDTTTAH